MDDDDASPPPEDDFHPDEVDDSPGAGDDFTMIDDDMNDDEVAPPAEPPDDDEDDLPPQHFRSGRNAAPHRLAGSAATSSTARNQQPEASSSYDSVRRRRPKGSMIWSTSSATDNATDHVRSQVVEAPRVTVKKQLHEVHESLRYRMVMRPRPDQPQDAEQMHILALVQSYFLANGYTKAAEALRRSNSLPDAAYQQLRYGPYLDLPRFVHDAASSTALLFDDETAWSTDTFFNADFSLKLFEQRGRSQFGTVDRLIEKLILEQADLPFGTTGVLEPHFTNVFLVMSSSFVCPDVLVSRLCKIFKTITLHGPLLGETKKVLWQTRVFQVMEAWASANRIDLTRIVTERMLSFAVSVVHGGNQAAAVSKAANSLLSFLRSLSSDPLKDGGRGRGAESHGSAARWKAVPSATGSIVPPMPAPPAAFRAQHEDSSSAIRSLNDVPELEVARQLCLVHQRKLNDIATRELVNNAWTNHINKPVAGNLQGFVKHYEDVSLWVTSLIVSPVDLEERRAVYGRCIRIMHHLFDLQNFSMAHAFFDGVDDPAVARMPETTARLPPTEQESLAAVRLALDPYQGTVRNIPPDLTTPCIPLLSTFIGEMARSHELHATTIRVPLSQWLAKEGDDSQQQPTANKHNKGHEAAKAAEEHVELVNWSKMMQQGKVLMRLVGYQRVPYPFQSDEVIQRFLAQMPLKRKDRDFLYDLAGERETAKAKPF